MLMTSMDQNHMFLDVLFFFQFLQLQVSGSACGAMVSVQAFYAEEPRLAQGQPSVAMAPRMDLQRSSP